MNIIFDFILDKKLSTHWKAYIFQSLYATLTVFLVIFMLQLEHAEIVASIGASAFIVFVSPKSEAAQKRNLIGGHAIGLIVGSLFSLIPHNTILSCSAVFAFSVGLTIFLMVITDTEHPPAAGTALGVAIIGLSPILIVSMVTSIGILALIQHLFRNRLVNLV